MTRLTETVLLLVTVPLLYRRIESTIITDPPVDRTTCYGGIATFTCGSDRGSDIANIQWTIDSVDVNDINTVESGILNQTSITDEYANTTLTIHGLQDNHDIIVGCRMVVNSSHKTEIKTATFTVTNIPPVTNLTIEFAGATMITTWQAPTVLPFEYHYQINISNDSDVLITNSTTVDPVYTMDITSCSNANYTVSVSVVDIGYTQLHSESSTDTAKYDLYEDKGVCDSTYAEQHVDRTPSSTVDTPSTIVEVAISVTINSMSIEDTITNVFVTNSPGLPEDDCHNNNISNYGVIGIIILCVAVFLGFVVCGVGLLLRYRKRLTVTFLPVHHTDGEMDYVCIDVQHPKGDQQLGKTVTHTEVYTPPSSSQLVMSPLATVKISSESTESELQENLSVDAVKTDSPAFSFFTAFKKLIHSS